MGETQSMKPKVKGAKSKGGSDGNRKLAPIPSEGIAQSILLVRGRRVILDADLAKLYGVETRVLKQAVRRNPDRFPDDFMFQLSSEEASSLRSQLVTSKGRGGRRYARGFPRALNVWPQNARLAVSPGVLENRARLDGNSGIDRLVSSRLRHWMTQ